MLRRLIKNRRNLVALLTNIIVQADIAEIHKILTHRLLDVLTSLLMDDDDVIIFWVLEAVYQIVYCGVVYKQTFEINMYQKYLCDVGCFRMIEMLAKTANKKIEDQERIMNQANMVLEASGLNEISAYQNGITSQKMNGSQSKLERIQMENLVVDFSQATI